MATNFIQAEDNTYSVQNLVYPEDLENNPAFNGNKILFFINVASSGKVSGFNGGEDYKLFDIPAVDLQQSSGNKIAQSTPFLNSISGAKKKRLRSAIALYLPNDINQGTSVNWSDEDVGSIIGESLVSVKQSTTDVGNADGFIASAKAVFSGVGDVVKTAASGGVAAAIRNTPKIQQGSRVTPGNSKAEQLFKGVGFRSISYNYTFSPKSESEAENVMNIIRMFKHHMLPEFADASKFLYIYPSEFNIKYYVGNKQNAYIEKQLTAVLTRVNVTYTPNGQYNAFSNGMAQQINMSLDFTEIALLTKEDVPFKFTTPKPRV